MAAFVSGIFNHAVSAAQTVSNTNPTSSPTPQAAGADGTSGTSTSSATITANDFLMLLVTEMKNQDPTANTDPNEYINQLVNVNSLQQLIQINQNLSDALESPASKTGAPASGQIPAAASAHATSTAHVVPGPHAAQFDISNPAAGGNLAAITSALKRAPGNLTVPDASPAAHSVANALGGKPHAHSIAGGPR
jgi:flagellar basal-body rod modification protein FlgD